MTKNIVLPLAGFFLSFGVLAQNLVTISGKIEGNNIGETLPFASIILKTAKDSVFVVGTTSADDGSFSLNNISPGNYILVASYLGYKTNSLPLFVGSLSPFLSIKTIKLQEDINALQEVRVKGKSADIVSKLDKKIFSIEDNISQSGGSILQAMQNLPGLSVQDGKVLLRGSDKITVLMDGKQTALTGFGNQSGLDNIPASAIEKIEVINNPSAKFDANGNAGIINIIYKKDKREGFNGKVGLTSGLGSLWARQKNFPNIRPQYTFTPKLKPNLALNYRNKGLNAFFNGDYLYTETLNKNEFVVRQYDEGNLVNQQLKRNRNTHFTTLKSGIDWEINEQNTLTISGLFGSEKIIDRGDEPFFNEDFSQRLRLWQFLEDELKTTYMATAGYQHKFKEPGHLFNAGFNYTFHREDEQYFYDNIRPNSTGTDAFKLLSDEQVYDLNADYTKPLKYGFMEVGLKLRKRSIPTNMQFLPGVNSVLDVEAGGEATYQELIPAAYGNYVIENERWEAELGLRVEYVRIDYEVGPNHPTYTSDGYNYTQPFPNMRLAYKINDLHKLSIFYNRRVDRPNEVDIRIFPKYDDAEIIKVGNPSLRPQFTNSLELGYKTLFEKGSIYTAMYHKFADATKTRISSIVPGSNLIYAIFQNAGKSYNTGIELIAERDISERYAVNLGINAYRNQINAFTVQNLYPVPHTFSAEQQDVFSGSLKLNNTFRFPNDINAQVSAVYLAPDIIPQGKIYARFSLDFGLKKLVNDGKGELFINATDMLSTMALKKEIQGNGFSYTSHDYYETQVFRIGYGYKF
ncbi:MAG: outer membrane receptor protein involved in Fe transport [Arcticibacterium sp.]|jgi:outer membrane receptor protein involved in Fe transport